MTIQEMINRKQELGYSNEQISALSGVPLGTVIKIFCGVTKNPRSTTIRALEKVLAPSRSRDCVLKLNKYMNAGVLEYWIVDPEYLKIIVYRLDEENHFRVYSFRDTVPLGISDGSCSVDFQDVFDEIQDLL